MFILQGILNLVISISIFLLFFGISYKLLSWIERLRDNKQAYNPIANIPAKSISPPKINLTPASSYKLTIEKQKETISYTLDKDTFSELMNKYFVDIDYLAKLYQDFPHDLTLTNDLKRHYSSDKLSDKVIGFIKIKSSHIYVKKGLSKKERTDVLIHELAHGFQFRNNPGKHLTHHGKEFKFCHRNLIKNRSKFYNIL